MSDKQHPTGQLYSRVYLERGTPLQDSARFRVRLQSYYLKELQKQHGGGILEAIHLELGTKVPVVGMGYNVGHFFETAELHDLLSSITLIFGVCKKSRNFRGAHNWILFVRRALQEENLGYLMDDAGGVHLKVDEEFQRNRAATIAALQRPEYAGVLAEFDGAHTALDRHPPDAKAALKSLFDAVETLGKLMIDKPFKTFGRNQIETDLTRIAKEVYKGDRVATDSATNLLKSFAEWVYSVHPYRHGQDSEVKVAPPLDLAIAIISSGASYLRWMAELDQQRSR